MDVIVSVAAASDIEKISQFAEKAGVSATGLDDENTQFLLMTTPDNKLVATIGIEAINAYAFFRTLIIDPMKCTSQKLFHLFDVAMGTAKTQGFNTVYFFTASNPSMFEPLGFSLSKKSEVPDDLFHSKHFKQTIHLDEAHLLSCGL